LPKGSEPMNLIWLDHPDAQDRAQVGGKAAQLAALVEDAPVPPGFVLTTTAYAHYAQLPQLPAALVHELSTAYTQLGERIGVDQPAIAVRSSAATEDGATASFAGQFQTVLNVRGIEGLLAAIAHCWAAARSPALAAYQTQQGVEAEPTLALLIQPLIEAERSAVVFSAHPTTGDQDSIVIEATCGLGEGLVGGQQTPDRFVVRKEDLALVDRQIAHKPTQIICAERGTIVAATPAAQQNTPALTDDQVIDLARLAIRLEARLGWPVDLECAYRADRLFLLQCRPITTSLQPAHAQAETGTPTVIWDRPEDAEATWVGGKEPVTPLQQSMSLHYYQGWTKAFRAVRAEGGLRARFVNGYEYRRWHFAPQQSWADVEAAQRAAALTLPQRWADEWLPAVQADLARWRAIDLATLPDDALAGHLQSMLADQLYHWEIHAHMGSAPLDAVQRLVDWYLARFPAAPESEPYRLVQGQSNVSLEANHQLWRLSNEANFAVLEALRAEDWAGLPRPFADQWRAYLEQYTDGLADSRRHAARLILRYAEQEVPDPLVAVQQQAAQRDAFIATVRAQLTSDEQPTFDELLAVAMAHNPLTEDHNLYLDQQSAGATRRVCEEFGRRLAAQGILETTEAVEFLHLHELIEWGFGLAAPLAPRVRERQAAYAAQRLISPAPFLGKAPEPASWTDRFSGPATPLPAESGKLRGIGASAGRVRGRARVAHTLAEAFALCPGEILVCPTTDPRWTPLFALAAALVTDHGGSLAHAAVVAREYQLPAVVGTHTATQQIHTGQTIEVDGLHGLVTLV
jgi:phosphohistidine swiveling domain-containing protein